MFYFPSCVALLAANMVTFVMGAMCEVCPKCHNISSQSRLRLHTVDYYIFLCCNWTKNLKISWVSGFLFINVFILFFACNCT